MSDTQQPAQAESVDRIRDIIFGPKMRDYEQRFDAFARDLDRLQQELNQLSEQLSANDAAQSRSLQALRQELRQADDETVNQLKAEAGRLTTELAEQAASHNTALQNLRQELRQADAGLRDELRQIAQRLTDEKTDRSTLGELFIELGNHVKTGGSLSELLKELGQAG